MPGLTKALWLTASVLSLFSQSVSAWPSPAPYDDEFLDVNVTHPFAEFGFGRPQKRAGDYELRILSFGASIMSGTGSSIGDGSRKPLRDALRVDGWDVNMVGSKCTGAMQDCNHEAVPGDTIDDAHARLENSLGYKERNAAAPSPSANIMLVNLGTNDGNQNIDIANVGSRMESIFDELWAADGMADTCIMLSTLLPTTNTDGAANRAAINGQYRALVTKKAGEGKCIYMADMQPDGQEWFDLNVDFHDDEVPKVHPNDKGHKMMAAVWYKWINKAIEDGKIKEPGDFTPSKAYCDKFEGSGTDAGGKTQRGSGYDDGKYSHDSEEMGIIHTRDSEWDRDQWKFARLFSEQYDDVVLWVDNDDESEIVFAAMKNSADGKGVFSDIDDMHGDMYCDSGKGVFFIDMNADGLDDFVCVDDDGNAHLSVNQGDGDRDGGKPPSFKNAGQIKTNEGTGRDRVVLGDIDGDGRGDYGVVMDKGAIKFWRNGGTADAPEYWQALGTRWDRVTPEAGIRFEDLNGDGRDDYMWVSDEDGAVLTYTNSYSCGKGVEGDGLKVAWRQATLRHGESQSTHLGVEAWADGDKKLAKRIHFARIYGTKTVFGNAYRQDYVYLKHSKHDGKHRFEMYAWKNLGTGGTKIKVDGNKYCNMMGHEDGVVDYVWTYQGGTMEMWASRGKRTITDNDPDGWWDYQGTIWTPPKEMHRKDLHLQDWDGDGDCDIIWNDPDNNNAVQVWLNNRPETGDWNWEHLSDPAPGVGCSEKRGLGVHDLAVRFADITGNKRADYLCLRPDGYVSAYLHQDDDSWEDAGQVKHPEGRDRANLRWVDVDGDGLDDMIWIEKFSGDTFVSYNGGRGSPETGGGSSFYWRRQTEIAYHGLAAGTCLFYADLDGSGRVDEHYVLESFNNIAKTSLSPLCGNVDATGDDDDMAKDLPEVPGGDGDVCTEGTGDGDLEDLCSYVCRYNYCKTPCTCTDTGSLNTAPEPSNDGGSSLNGDPAVNDLCNWACSRSFCPKDVCISSTDPDDTCQWDPQEAESWDNSGAGDLVESYIQGYGNDDWLRGMDVLYNLGSGHSNLNCDDVASNTCVGPQGACTEWDSPSFWYVRTMASRINSHFKFAHEKLQDETIRNLGLVDQMVQDFKMDVPDTDLLKQILGSITGVTGLASLITKRGSQGVADIFTLIGGIATTTNAQASTTADDLDKYAAAAKKLVTDILEQSDEQLEKTLPAFFGNGELSMIETLYDKIVDAGIMDPSTRISAVSRILDGGAFMVPVLESDVSSAITDGIKDTIAAVLGGLLSALHYLAVHPLGCTAESCAESKACRRIDDGCVYLVRRPKGKSNSQTTPDDLIDILENEYNISLDEMLRNIKDCGNRQPSDEDKGAIYIGSGRYAPCYFSIGYVDSMALDYPIAHAANEDELPDWVGSDDIWNGARDDVCSLPGYGDYPVCKS